MGTWPAPACSSTSSPYLFFGYLCAYYVRLGSRPLNWAGLASRSAWSPPTSPSSSSQFAAFDGQSAWFLSLFLLGFSSILGAVNYLTTVVKLRCPGMTMFRLPLSVWSLFITSILVLLATPVLASVLIDEPAGPPPPDQLLPAVQLAQLQPAPAGFGGQRRRGRRRVPAAPPAPVLVLQPPRRLHHDPAGDGHGPRHHGRLRPQADLRLPPDGLRPGRHRLPRVHRLGPPHVPVAA